MDLSDGRVAIRITISQAGVTVATVAGPYTKALASEPVCASGFVTTTVASPAPCVPVVAVIVVELTTATLVALTPPINTVAPATKFAPVIVRAVFVAFGA